MKLFNKKKKKKGKKSERITAKPFKMENQSIDFKSGAKKMLDDIKEVPNIEWRNLPTQAYIYIAMLILIAIVIVKFSLF